jgi:hypothetical protein
VKAFFASWVVNEGNYIGCYRSGKIMRGRGRYVKVSSVFGRRGE